MKNDKSDYLTVKDLKLLLDGVNEDAIVFSGYSDRNDNRNKIFPTWGYDYFHSTDNSGSSLGILVCGRSWNKESCNILFLFQKEYMHD